MTTRTTPPQPWILTHTGRQFWPLAPRAEDVVVRDIAHALSCLSRFGGHCRSFYSVAQHSVTVSQHVPQPLALAALFHDGAEAYVGDMTRPLKQSNELKGFCEIENRVLAAIASALGFDPVLFDEADLLMADFRMLMTERRDLMPPGHWHIDEKQCYEFSIVPCSPFTAEERFYRRYQELARHAS